MKNEETFQCQEVYQNIRQNTLWSWSPVAPPLAGKLATGMNAEVGQGRLALPRRGRPARLCPSAGQGARPGRPSPYLRLRCPAALVAGGAASGGQTCRRVLHVKRKNSAFCIPRRRKAASGQLAPPEAGLTWLNSAFSSAFTLIELIVTIAIASIAVLALVIVFQEALKNMERQRGLVSANLLAEDLMNEIRSKKYVDSLFPTNFGPEVGETNGNNRLNFDDADDYDNYFEPTPMTIEGIIMTNLSGFTWRAVVVNVPATNFNSPPAPDNSTDFKRITVIVSNAAVAVSNMAVKGRYD